MASTLAAHPVPYSRSQPGPAILLVEDDLDIAGMYRLQLQTDGYQVHVAVTGEAALALAFQSRTDLVLLDMGLPTIDGLHVLRALRSDHRTVSLPVVILSNNDDPVMVDTGLQLGALDYLVKSQVTPAGVSGRIGERKEENPGCRSRSRATGSSRVTRSSSRVSSCRSLSVRSANPVMPGAP